MIRKAVPEDRPALAAFFERHIETSMFLLNNLELHGIGNTDHRYGTSFFLRETGDGITGVFGATNGGMLLCQLPGLTATEAQTYAHLLRGYTLRGMSGAADQAALILAALSLPEDGWLMNDDEPLFRLGLEALPEQTETVRPVTPDDAALLRDWSEHYLLDTGLAAAPLPETRINQHVRSIAMRPEARLLIEAGAPVALSSVNARAGSTVQLGGVFVPRVRRGQGLAGRVVLGQLASLRTDGITQAILFAASDDAARAYTKIGFERIGAYRVAILRDATTLGALR